VPFVVNLGHRHIGGSENLRAEVREWLKTWFSVRNKIGKAAAVQGDALLNTDYFDAGWLTSMEVVEFVTEIESQFDIQFSDRDLQDPRFATIAGLTELILEHSSLPSESR